MNYTKFFSLSALVVVLVLITWLAFGSFAAKNLGNPSVSHINSFEDCAQAGYPIMESYPEQCRTPDGRTFVNNIQPHSSSLGVPTEFMLNQKITFEDGLELTLKKINDSRCKEGVVCVWAGELDYLFEAIGGSFGENKYEFNLGTSRAKEKKASGYTFNLNEGTENAVTITVSKTQQNNGTVGACYVGGCSSQVCSDQPDAITTCEYREEYACYKTAKCERQSNGQCGWTMTSQLQACLTTSMR